MKVKTKNVKVVKKIDNSISLDKFLLAYVLPVIIILSLAIICFLRSYVFNDISINTTYYEKGKVDYDVNLIDNSYYKEKTLPSGMKYVASIIDTINPRFKYEVHADNNLNLNYSYEVTSQLLIIDYENNDKILQKTDEVLLKKVTNSINDISFEIDETIPIDYKKYSTYVTNFKKGLSLPVKAELIVTMNINVLGDNKNLIKDFNKNRTLEVRIPFNVQTVEVIIPTEKINNTDYLYTRISPIANRVVFYLFIALSVLSVFLIINLFRGISKYKKYNRYYKDLNKILKNYDKIIVNGDLSYDEKKYKNILNVDSFEEMVDASVNLNKPIIFNEDKKGKKSIFIIIAEDMIYKYILENKNTKKDE